MKFTMPMRKAQPMVHEDGSLTPRGIETVTQYARAWSRGERDLMLERMHPDLEEAFYDIRVDEVAAKEWAAEKPKYVLPMG